MDSLFSPDLTLSKSYKADKHYSMKKLITLTRYRNILYQWTESEKKKKKKRQLKINYNSLSYSTFPTCAGHGGKGILK